MDKFKFVFADTKHKEQIKGLLLNFLEKRISLLKRPTVNMKALVVAIKKLAYRNS